MSRRIEISSCIPKIKSMSLSHTPLVSTVPFLAKAYQEDSLLTGPNQGSMGGSILIFLVVLAFAIWMYARTKNDKNG